MPSIKIQPETPVIDYMAKDYESFRRVLIDRLKQIIPSWKEESKADLGIALIELMAYIGDHLSYYQDSVANEMYLKTARKRISVRRHARLIDYHIHEGHSARAFIHLNITGHIDLQKGTVIFSKLMEPISDEEDRLKPAPKTEEAPKPLNYLNPPHESVIESTYEEQVVQHAETVFESITEGRLFEELNEIKIYTWGNTVCCLPKGSTS